MFNPFHIFRIKKEERWLMLFVLLFLVALHTMLICKYYGIFSPLQKFYWPVFIKNFHVSGFDPITYVEVSNWGCGYNVFRHPLLSFFMYPAYLLNQGLMALTGRNWAIIIVAAMQLFWGFYAMLFFYRIVREVIGVCRSTATILTIFFLSFAFVMLSCIVPDHFVISMMLLLLALYISGRRIKSGNPFTIWQTVLYFMLTAGVSLNNGLKIFLANLFVNKRRFFRPWNLLLGVILPAALIWGFANWEYKIFVWPEETAKHKVIEKRRAEKKKHEAELQLLRAKEDSIRRANGDTAALLAKNSTQKTDSHKPVQAKKSLGPRQGKPISNGQFMKWTDATSSRWDATVENLLGESIQLHQDYLLGDVMHNRPMVVRYNCLMPYVVEAFIALLFIIGVWIGRRKRFMWLVLSFFGIDVALHIGLGFGINEVYIMSAHWIYAIPICLAYLLKACENNEEKDKKWIKRTKLILPSVIGVIAVYLLLYNSISIASYLL